MINSGVATCIIPRTDIWFEFQRIPISRDSSVERLSDATGEDSRRGCIHREWSIDGISPGVERETEVWIFI